MRKSVRRTFIVSTVVCLAFITGCSDTEPVQESTPSDDTTASSQSPSTKKSPDAGKDIIDNAPANSWQDALEAADKEFSGNPSKIELESTENGGLEYEIELKSDDTQYQVQFDAESLKKLSEAQKGLGDDLAKELKETFDPFNHELGVEFSDAVATARDQQAGTVTSWKIEGKDDASVYYAFVIDPDDSDDDVEIQVDAKDGTVIIDS